MTRILILVLLLAVAVLAFSNPDRIRDLFTSTQAQRSMQPKSPEVNETGKNNVKSKNVTKSEVYKWVDSIGKIHYSDKASDTSEQSVEKITVVSETTEFTKTPPIQPIYGSNVRQTSAQTSRSVRCQRLKKQATKDKKKVRRAGRFSTQDQKLREKRWEIIKNC